MFDPFSVFCFGILLLFVPVEAITMSLPCYQVIAAVAIYVCNDNGYSGFAQFKFFMHDPGILPGIFRCFEPAIAHDKITTAIAIDIAETNAMALCGGYLVFCKAGIAAIEFINQ